MVKFSTGDINAEEDDIDKFIVITNLHDTSLRSNVSNALTVWTRKMWPEYQLKIANLAQKHKLSEKEVYWRARFNIAIDAPSNHPMVVELRAWMNSEEMSFAEIESRISELRKSRRSSSSD